MIRLRQDLTIQEILDEEKEIVENYWQIKEDLEIRVSKEVLSSTAIDVEDYRGCLIARSNTHDYLFVVEDDFDSVLTNGQVYYDIQATPRGSEGGTPKISMLHRCLA